MAANFSMHAGDTKILEVSVKTSAGSSVDITGTAIRFQLAKSATSRPPLVSKALGSGITLVNGPAGRFDVRLEPDDTVALKGTHYYEAEIDDAGIISTVLYGNVNINAALIDPT